jgi:hypothetical protein
MKALRTDMITSFPYFTVVVIRVIDMDGF